ncbi:MAG: Fe-S cluster assembly ATPase SufC [Thermoprotei archaeon]|jgi:Fe-S cluster assembly ATP-binding protein
MKMVLTVEQLCVAAKSGKDILKGVSFSLPDGEVRVIMGPNGSGKSTLALTLAGSPDFLVKSGRATFDGVDLLSLTPDERARRGLFLAFQKQVEIPGVPLRDMIWEAYRARWSGPSRPSMIDFRKKLSATADFLSLPEAFLERGVNEGFSGGEAKKSEILQMLMLQPKLAILDEVDSGLDVDSLKVVADAIRRFVEGGSSALIITHHFNLLNYIEPDVVYVMKGGKIVDEGDINLAKIIETEGYSRWGVE